MALRTAKRLQFENRSQAPQEIGAIFGFLFLLRQRAAGFLDDTFAFEFTLREQFAQSRETLGRFAQHFRHDRLADLENFAVVLRPDSGRTRFAGEQREFTETIALAHRADAHARAVARDRHRRHAAQHHEHRIAGVAFLDQTLAATVAMNRRILEHGRELTVVHAIEERLASQDRARFGLRVAGPLRAALDLKRADWERNRDLLASKFVPDVSPDRVANVVIRAMIAHRELDFVDHG